MRFDALEARMSVMTPEERAAFAAKAAEIAARPVAAPATKEQPAAEAEPAEAAAAPETAEEAPAAAAE